MTEEKTGSDAALQAKVAELEGKLTAANNELAKVRNSAASYRVGRSQALRQVYALRQVLGAHKVTFDLDSADLDGLVVDDGKVSGEFSYTPPATTEGNKPADPPGEASAGLTEEDIAAMSPQQIADQWDEVMKAENARATFVPSAV